MPKREEPSIEDLWADVVRRMKVPGARRIELLAELQELDEVLFPLVVEASELGMTTRRIGELVGLTGSAVTKWVQRSRRNN